MIDPKKRQKRGCEKHFFVFSQPLQSIDKDFFPFDI